MTTWVDIQTWLRTRFLLVRDEASWCGLAVQREDGPQLVVIKAIEDAGRPALILAARVCERHLVDPIEALRYNGMARDGALVIEGEAFLLRQVLPFARLELADLENTIQAVIVEATRLRRRQQAMASASSHPAVNEFAYWAD